MRNVKCSYCEESRNAWCEKVIDSPHPDILRDCQYFHEAKTRWIPCDERMPNIGESVLVTTHDECRVWICHPYREDDYMWEDDAGYLRDKHDAVAWMQIPEPYKEGQDG